MSICGISFDEIDEFLIQTVSIEAQINTPDGAGGTTTTWDTPVDVDGLLSELNGKEIAEMEKINPKINAKVFLKKGSTVTLENRITIDSIHYSIGFIKNPVSADEFLICYVVTNAK